MPEYVTREEGCRLAAEKLGVPLTLPAIELAVSRGYGPKAAAKYGRRLLYKPDEFLNWVESRIEPMAGRAA